MHCDKLDRLNEVRLCPCPDGFYRRTLDFLRRQAEQATDAFFFDELSVGDNRPGAFRFGAGANLRGWSDSEAI